jgi:membrane protease YdiL (CAAX protease family)
MSKDLYSKEWELDKIQRRGHMSNPVKAIVTIIGVVYLFLSAQLAAVVLTYSILELLGFNSDHINTLLTDNVWVQTSFIFVIELLTIGVLAILNRARKQNFIKSVDLHVFPYKRILSYVLVSYLLYTIAFIIVATVVSLFVPALDTNQAQQLGFDTPEGVELLAVFTSLVLFPAIAEEILFRGFLFKRLSKLLSIRVAALTTSVVFGLAHLEFLSGAGLNWIAALDTFVFSFFLIYVYLKTKSLWAAILLHAIKNSIAFVLLFVI